MEGEGKRDKGRKRCSPIASSLFRARKEEDRLDGGEGKALGWLSRWMKRVFADE